LKLTIRDSTSKNQDVLTNDLPLKRIRHPTHVLYLSAIAHRITTQYGVSTAEIATAMAQAMNPPQANCWNGSGWDELTTIIWQGITVQVTAANDLLFQVHDRAIASWLNGLVEQPLSLPASLPPASPPLNPFPLQSAHARCCSLLRLADRTGLISLQQPEANPLTWQWLQPAPISWLTATEQLYVNHLAERCLISQICTVLDMWFEPSPPAKVVVQQAERLAQVFEEAHRAYPIWGDRSPEARDQQQSHLGLLLVTQRVLQCCLDGLGIPAPTEL
jgi:hypothetical protein